MRARGACCGIAAALALACAARSGRRAGPAGPREQGRLLVRSFSETRPVIALARARGSVFVAQPDRVLVWDDASGRHRVLACGAGLACGAVRAVTADLGGGVWLATDRGVSRWRDGGFGDPAAGAPAAATEAAAMVAAPDGSAVWLAGPRGAARADAGGYRAFLEGTALSALCLRADGRGVWTAGRSGPIHDLDPDRGVAHGAAEGMALAEVGALATTPQGMPLATGAGRDADALALHDGRRWWTYRSPDGAPLRALGRTAAGTEVAWGGRPCVLSRSGRGVALRAAEGAAPPLRLACGDGRVPADLTAAWADPFAGLLFGTRHAGAVAPDGDAWRAQDLFGDADRIDPACVAGAERCYFAAGGRAWAYGWGTLAPVVVDPAPEARALAFATAPGGAVVAVSGARGSPTLALSREQDGAFEPDWSFSLEVPGRGEAGVRFCGYAPDGSLWLGLTSDAGDGDARPRGVAAWRPDGGAAWHLPGEDVLAVAFATEQAWLATTRGLVRIGPGETRRYGESDGLWGEIVGDVALAPDGTVWVATPHGLARLRGERFESARGDLLDGLVRRGEEEIAESARTAALALFASASGDLYAASTRGVVVIEAGGGKRLIAARHGLLDDHALDVSVDPAGRVWVLTAEGLSVVE